MASDPASVDELRRAAGNLLQNASTNEMFMCNAFKILSGCDIKIATAIFYTLDSLPAKKTLLKRVLDVKSDEEEKKLVNAIIDAAEKSNNQRKDISHSLLAFKSPDINSAFTLYRPKSSESKSVTKNSLATLIRHSQDAITEAQQAFEQLCQKRGVPVQLEL